MAFLDFISPSNLTFKNNQSTFNHKTMKYLYNNTSKKAVVIALYTVLFGLLLVGQMSCTAPSKTKLETGENSLFLCKFVNPDGVTANTAVFQRNSMYSPGDTLLSSKYGTWLIMSKQNKK
jgi:hypothetical protein